MDAHAADLHRLLEEQRTHLAETVVQRQYAAEPGLERRYGPEGRAKCLQDALYHLSYLAEAVAADSPALFADYVAWAKVMLWQRQVPAGDLARHLELLLAVGREQLPPAMHERFAAPIHAALEQLPRLPADVPTFLAEDQPHAALAEQYLRALLPGDRHLASRLVLDAVQRGVPVRDVYLHVFQRAQREIGRLWQTNRISVAQEHYCTAATQLIMSQLYPHIFSSEKHGRRLVATCVSGDLHELGVRMVADFFELDGWHTYYLGANTPAESVVRTLAERRADVLGVSATITSHVRAVARLIETVRATPACAGVCVLVGGYPFNVAPTLWRSVGADGWAPDAREATRVARTLLGVSGPRS